MGERGFAFALLVAAWVAMTRVTTAVDAPDHILDVYDETSIQVQAFVGTLVLAIAAVCFLAFLSDLVNLLRRAGGSDGPLATLALAGGVGFLVLLLSAGCMFTVLPNLIAYDEVSVQVDPDIAAVTVQVGYLLLYVYASAAAIGMVDVDHRPTDRSAAPMALSRRVRAVRPAPTGPLGTADFPSAHLDRGHRHRPSPTRP